MTEEIQRHDAAAGLATQPVGSSLVTSECSARSDLTDWWSFAATTALALVVYWFTMPPNLTPGWAGIFSAGAMYGGVPFAGGYPVWTLYSWLFIHLVPFSNIAWRVGLGAAVTAAVACGLIAMMVSHSGKMILTDMPAFTRLKTSEQKWLRGVCGYVAGLAFGFSGTVWSEAIVGEFWALGFLLFAGVLCLFMHWFFEPIRRRLLYGAFLLFGLLLTNNQELLVALPGLICGIMLADENLGRDSALFVLPLATVLTARNQWSVWIHFPAELNWPMLGAFLAVVLIGVALAVKTRGVGSNWKATLSCGVALVVGLAFYLYLPIASMTNPPVNWGYPRTVEGFFHAISRGQFEKAHPTDDIATFVGQVWWYFQAMGGDFGWLFLVFALLPFGFIRSLNLKGRRCLLSMLSVFLCVGLLLLALLNPPSDNQALMWDQLRPYFGASGVVLALGLGLGVMMVGAWVARRDSRVRD